MAQPPPETLEPLHLHGFPAGINNILPEYALAPAMLRDSNNVDLYDDGKLRRRKGSAKRVSLVGAHSFWSDPKNPRPDVSYYVAGTTMYSLKLNAGTLTSAVIVTGLAAGRKVAYLYLNGDVFWSNGLVNGRIRNGVNGDWGVETPAQKPTLTASVVGGLYPGKYQVALTFRNSFGEESGTDVAQTVNVPTGGSIILTTLPVPVSADVTQICVYATPANGEALHKVAILPSNASTYTISTMSNAGTLLKTQFLQQMPPGDRLAHVNGFIFAASGSTVFYSEPLRYGLCNLNESFYMFPQTIDEILTVPDGIYVCADKTYYLDKPPHHPDGGVGTQEVKQVVVFPFGAVRGTGAYLPTGTDVAWFSPRGQVVATLQGQAKIVTAADYMPGIMSSGASIIREKQGLRQFINTIQQTDTSPLEYSGG